jgi:hypothetical protein
LRRGDELVILMRTRGKVCKPTVVREREAHAFGAEDDCSAEPEMMDTLSGTGAGRSRPTENRRARGMPGAADGRVVTKVWPDQKYSRMAAPRETATTIHPIGIVGGMNLDEFFGVGAFCASLIRKRGGTI